MARILRLTTPYTSGPDVKAAQRLLATNVFGEDFGPGDIDGEFGPVSAGASKRAKLALGYPSDEVLPTFGNRLNEFLSGTEKLPSSFAGRRTERSKRSVGRSSVKSRALTLARGQIGYVERPTNRTKFGAWYGMDGSPWCAMFVTWCMVKAAEAAGTTTSFAKGERWAYVPYVVSAAVGGRYHLSVTKSPGPGDVVTYDWEHNGVADHIGIFVEWLDRGRGTFRAVEGNTSPANNSNGGQVMYRDRTRSLVRAFIHVP